MDDTDQTPTTETAAPNPPPATPTKKKRRKYTRRKQREAAKPKPPDEFAGISARDCPFACSAKRCVITGAAVCGHPMKGAMQMAGDEKAVERWNKARRVLAHEMVEKKVA